MASRGKRGNDGKMRRPPGDVAFRPEVRFEVFDGHHVFSTLRKYSHNSDFLRMMVL